MRLFHKLFLMFSLMAMVAALAMAGVLAWNLGRGFTDYLDARDSEMLAAFGAELETYLTQSRAADAAAPTSAEIQAAVLQMAASGQIRELPPRTASKPPVQSGIGPSPDSRPNKRGPPPVAFGRRLRVFGTDGELLFGPARAPDHLEAASAERSIDLDGTPVASIKLLPRGPAPRSTDTVFLRGQYVGMGLVTALLLVLSGISAWFLARAVTGRVQAFRQTTEEISKGNFEARMHYSGSDEIADLALDINAMAESLQRLQSARKRWLAEISHELRTPLTVLRGELEILEQGIRPITIEAVQSLSEEAQSLNAIVDDLHLLAISDLGTVSIHPQSFDVISFLQHMAERSEGEAEDAGLTIVQDYGSLSVLVAEWDSRRIAQLVSNLLSNAIRYTDAPGIIRLGLSMAGGFAVLTVEDSAPGVPADQFTKLFEPLHRQEEARDRISGGSGLGLAVAQAIAGAHGGSIHAGASSLGGLAVTVKLPIKAERK